MALHALQLLAAVDQCVETGVPVDRESRREQRARRLLANELAAKVKSLVMQSVGVKKGVEKTRAADIADHGDLVAGQPHALKSFVERKRETGISLSVLGFGRGNYNDELMQVLAQNGNGNAAYIDSLKEAQTVYGKIGMKVWICRGESYGKVDLSPVAETEKRGRGGDRGSRGGRERRRRNN